MSFVTSWGLDATLPLVCSPWCPCSCCPHTCPRPHRPSLCSARMESCRSARRWFTPCPSMRLTSSTPVLRASWPSSQVSCPSPLVPSTVTAPIFWCAPFFLFPWRRPPPGLCIPLLALPPPQSAFCSPFEFILLCMALSSSLGSCLLSFVGHSRVLAWLCSTTAPLWHSLPLSLPLLGLNPAPSSTDVPCLWQETQGRSSQKSENRSMPRWLSGERRARRRSSLA